MIRDSAPLPASFFARDPLEVAPELLGAELVCRIVPGTPRVGRIVEVEAYRGGDDPASHAYRGPTPRTEVMFGPAGHLYVYRSYGIHWCVNVVCGDEGVAAAVLLRALQPLEGLEAMFEDRPRANQETDLASGPGKLCAAMGITGGDSGRTVSGKSQDPVALLTGAGSPETVRCGPRVGVSVATDRPWRFWLDGNPHVSRGAPRAV